MTAALALILFPVTLLTGFFALETMIGLKAPRSRLDLAGRATNAVIVIPAHDEALVIAATLASLSDATAGAHRVLVVADNCVDDTASIARAAGADVIERKDNARRGKGFALDFAARHLEFAAPEVVVILDADCRIDGKSLAVLIAVASEGRPAQAVNLLVADLRQTAMVQVSAFAFLIKNLFRQRGLQRLSGRVHLTGTGMAIPFDLFRSSGLASDNIVEDLALGIELANRGRPATLVSEATVWSEAASESGTLVQRQRWEGGFLKTAVRHGPALIWSGLSRLRPSILWAGLDLMVPPLALLGVMNLVFLGVGVASVLLFSAAWWPLVVHCIAVLTAGLAILIVWLLHGRRFLSAAALLKLPLYLLWKFPMYLRLGRKGAPGEWLRTGR